MDVNSSPSFAGSVVAVAGGSSGINLGIADAFAAQGARVAVVSRSRQKLDAAVERLLIHGGEAIGFSADVRDPEAVDAALSAIHQAFGDIDVLVSGAAGNFPAPALGMSPNAFASVVDIDLRGTFHVLRSAYPYLTRPGASIINISAPQAYVPMAFQAHVCAAKAGVDMVTRVLAMEWGPAGIRVNSVVPGPVEGTEGMKRLSPTPELQQAVAESVPLGRLGTPMDIANTVMFLASPLAGYVTGAIIPVDGGWSLGGASVVAARMAKAAGESD
ncbi:MAG: SDR family oxidoreductase [Candidatus Thiodiazotropha sp. (ex Dulcina madagascariensis)]|nr:SDR family oxidoreductase [Candidatus Thiodiazotropha sp. (ex Dulcina madagascariensis)]MCU7927248.1 SDR family oxidoreductase [Candidatus Thiodiazotropha sp. (ex Dulcina madagascariensis)]